jgi:hypothetical protein
MRQVVPFSMSNEAALASGVDLVELVPDQAMIVEVDSTGERDLRTYRQHDLGLGATIGGEAKSAIDKTTIEITPITCGGPKLAEWKKKPVGGELVIF